MRCVFCGEYDSRVLDSRGMDEGRGIRRRRECLSCKKRFTTHEKPETLPLMVVKKDGSKEHFNPNKILNGLIKACDKRAVSLDVIEIMAADIERELRNLGIKEIASKSIGDRVMQHLREVDAVAYICFASVYRNFGDIDTFMEELQQLQKEMEELKK